MWYNNLGDIMNKKIIAVVFAILAAALYAINVPCSKLLLNELEPAILASYLYLGAGIGIGIILIFYFFLIHQ